MTALHLSDVLAHVRCVAQNQCLERFWTTDRVHT